MSLPGHHPDTGQFLCIDAGQGRCVKGPSQDHFSFAQEFSDGWYIQVPDGTWHGIINTAPAPPFATPRALSRQWPRRPRPMRRPGRAAVVESLAALGYDRFDPRLQESQFLMKILAVIRSCSHAVWPGREPRRHGPVHSGTASRAARMSMGAALTSKRVLPRNMVTLL